MQPNFISWPISSAGSKSINGALGSSLEAAQFVPPPRSSKPAMARKIGRNEPCPCGSELKYKMCCLAR
ncbi:SEC-C domain-containing protein [Bradyrhizobium diazoefficiens]|nr:SEC-C domain-containing protein [Bradyrhizobium diazoefficiens]